MPNKKNNSTTAQIALRKRTTIKKVDGILTKLYYRLDKMVYSNTRECNYDQKSRVVFEGYNSLNDIANTIVTFERLRSGLEKEISPL